MYSQITSHALLPEFSPFCSTRFSIKLHNKRKTAWNTPMEMLEEWICRNSSIIKCTSNPIFKENFMSGSAYPAWMPCQMVVPLSWSHLFNDAIKIWMQVILQYHPALSPITRSYLTAAESLWGADGVAMNMTPFSVKCEKRSEFWQHIAFHLT